MVLSFGAWFGERSPLTAPGGENIWGTHDRYKSDAPRLVAGLASAIEGGPFRLSKARL